jgi:hypothetical protein
VTLLVLSVGEEEKSELEHSGSSRWNSPTPRSSGSELRDAKAAVSLAVGRWSVPEVEAEMTSETK